MNDRKAPEPSFEIPDLELAAPVSKQTVPARKPRAAAPLTPETAAFGLEISLPELDDEDEQLLQKGSNVELSLGTSPEAARREHERWPHGHTRPTHQLPIDPTEVTLTAGYGSAPANAALSPLYAYRVLSRRSPLKKAIANHAQDLAQAELARDQQLMQLCRELRSVLEANDSFRRLLEPIRDVERTAGDRQAALSAADASYREQMARFDAQLARFRDDQANAEALHREKASRADADENELRRAEAKLQRVQIEIRGVLEVARRALGPAGGDMAPEHAAALAELRARADLIEPEVAQSRAAHSAATTAEDQAEAEVRRIQGQIRQIERQKGSAGSSLEQQLSVRARSASEAEAQRRAAMADVARSVLATRGAIAVPASLLQTLREHDEGVEALAIRLETHVRALDSYEHARVKQGIILVLSALGVVLVSIFIKAML